MYENKVSIAAPARPRRVNEEPNPFSAMGETTFARQSQTASALDALENSLGGLFVQIESLQDRLHPALRPEPVTASKEERSSLPLAPVAEAVRMLNERVAVMTIRMEDMLNRLEL